MATTDESADVLALLVSKSGGSGDTNSRADKRGGKVEPVLVLRRSMAQFFLSRLMGVSAGVAHLRRIVGSSLGAQMGKLW